ncbi:MAG: CBS domain-containing protein [Lentisphaeraceae bacterium]|nr:CBS domain-containing protein [Lentisphaeraceae bacterium]
MLVKDVMTKDLVVAEMDYTLTVVEKIMDTKKINHIFVLDTGVLRGVISDGDVKRRKSFLAGKDISSASDDNTLLLKAHQFMSRSIVSIDENTPVKDAIDKMLENHIHCLPVMNSRDRLAGVVTTSDFLRAMRNLL